MRGKAIVRYSRGDYTYGQKEWHPWVGLLRGESIECWEGEVQPRLKVHKHEIYFLTFFAETESLWSQGPVTRDF